VSSVSADGVGNLAPHSFYTVAYARPPIVQFTSVGEKDTLRNVRETGEYVINVASLPALDAVNSSSARYEGTSMRPRRSASPWNQASGSPYPAWPARRPR